MLMIRNITVLVLVLLLAQGPNKEWPGPQPWHGEPCAVATKAHTVVITLLSVSHGVETLRGVPEKNDIHE